MTMDLNMGNPMTNPPKSSKIKKDLFDIIFRNPDDGQIYLYESEKFYRSGEVQEVRRASFSERLSSAQTLKTELTGKRIHVIFLPSHTP